MDSQLVLIISSAGALFLIVSLGVGCGVAGAWLRARSMHQLQLVHEDRLSILEGQIQREVKTRAGMERWNKKNPDPVETKLVETMHAAQPYGRQPNWWQTGAPRSFNGKS